MKTIVYIALCLFLSISGFCTNPKKTIWNERSQDSLEPTKVQEGVPAWDAVKIDYRRDGKKILSIDMPEAVAAAVADRDWGWGFFQFPSIGLDEKGVLAVSWQMAEDSNSPDKKKENIPAYLVSYDNGRTWHGTNKRIHSAGNYSVRLPNGDILGTADRSIRLKGLRMPEPLESLDSGHEGIITYYRESELPDTLRGAYFTLWHHDTGEIENIHAPLDDPGLVRYAHDASFFPVLWRGNIRIDKDGALYAVPYPTFYEEQDHKVTQAMSGTCYKSTDGGRSWTAQGSIPYTWDPALQPRGATKRHYGFSEHSFEILPDGSFYCVIRSDGPMYWTRSSDKGKTWMEPKCFTPYGVRPTVFRLKNGVLVLVSGRPGVQIRISYDGYGRTWTDPIELIHYGEYTSWKQLTRDSCGNPSIQVAGKNSFYIAYSDFQYPAGDGKLRKAIKVRKITIKKK